MRRLATTSLLCASLILLAACGRSAPPPSTRESLAEGQRTPAAAEKARKYAEEASAFAKAYPWGDYTGTARLHGVVTWAEGSAQPEPLARRPLLLKGIKGTPTDGMQYRLRTNERGEFDFDRIKGGEFKLSDDITDPFHWRLRVEIRDGQNVTLDLTPDNSVTARDDFPETTAAAGPSASGASADSGTDRASGTTARLDEPTAAAVTER